MQVRECMSHDVQVISPQMPIIEAARKMRNGDFGALPVGANDRARRSCSLATTCALCS